MMERQISHMVRLIDDLLDVARISAGKIELQREPVPVSNIIASAIESTRIGIEAARLELIVETPEPGLLLNADATRLAQVIANILQNAAKFTPAGGRVRLVAERNPHEAGTILIRISDTGIGIAADQLPRVFDLFAQAGTRVRGHQGGLGIGLAIARQLIEMHGGSIAARSEGENRGSEFIITLPAAIESPSEASDAPEVRPSLTGLEVLIVDDNPDAADSMALLVQLEGARTRTVYSGPAAIAAIDEHQPDAVLLDIGMPGMNGYEVCKRVRATHGSGVAMIAVSGWGQEGDKALAMSAGFDAHLTKPADPDDLQRIVVKLRKPG
jgi:CheY-like chemotaxis protein